MPTSISQFARPLVNEGLISEDWRNNEDELALVREFAEFSKRLPSSIKRHERVARFAKLKGITPTHSPKTPKLYDLYGTNLYSYAKLLVSAGLISQGWKRNPNDLETIHKFFQFLKSVDVNLSQEEKVQAGWVAVKPLPYLIEVVLPMDRESCSFTFQVLPNQ